MATCRFDQPTIVCVLGVRVVAVVASVLMAGAVLAQSRCDLGTGYGWQTTNWWVRCGPDVISTLEMFDMLITSEVFVGAECDDTNTTGAAAATRAELEEASVWLKSLCFRNPKVPLEIRPDNDDVVYTAWISDDAQAIEYGEDFSCELGGNGVLETDESASLGLYLCGNIFVNSDSFFAMGESGVEYLEDVAETGTMVHELFHAIQAQYPLFGESPGWVLEGMADAVMLSWLRRDFGSEMQTPQRKYDHPLHRPRPRPTLDAYGTYRWWLWLGKTLGSPDWIGYLADLLIEFDFAEHDGLSDLETWLDDKGVGLYELYPAFIAESVRHPALFTDVREERIRYREDRTVEEERKGSAREVAAEATQLRVEIPNGERAQLTIRIEPDHDALHLAVDSNNYSTPAGSLTIDESAGHLRRDVRDPAWLEARNRFRTVVVGGDEPPEFFIRVTNVDEDPVTTEPRDYRLEFELEPFGTCEFSASISGDTGSTSARGRVAHFSATGGATSTGMLMNPGNAEGMAAMIEAMAGDRITDEERAELRAGAEAWSREAASMPTETLGISLMEMDPERDGASQLAAAIGGFRLTASVFDQPIEPGFRGGLQPGLITVLTGDTDEAATAQTRFAWAPGEPGSGAIEITRYTEKELAGTIRADLEAQGVLDPETREPLRIQLTASFVARAHDPLRGELGCIGVDE